MNTATTQIGMDFATKSVVVSRKARQPNKATLARYTEALDYLRAELANGPAVIVSNEFAGTFNITSNFLNLCVRLGAIEITKGKGKRKSKTYEALPRLATLSGFDMCRAGDQLGYDMAPSVGPSETFKTVVITPEMAERLADASEIGPATISPPGQFIYGFVQADTGDVYCNHRDIHNTETEALAAALDIAKVGTKIAVMHITQVVCAKLTALPATL